MCWACPRCRLPDVWTLMMFLGWDGGIDPVKRSESRGREAALNESKLGQPTRSKLEGVGTPRLQGCRARLGPAGFAQPCCPWLWFLGLLKPDVPCILGRWI